MYVYTYFTLCSFLKWNPPPPETTIFIAPCFIDDTESPWKNVDRKSVSMTLIPRKNGRFWKGA